MSSDLVEEMFLDYVNAVEAGIAAAKQRYKEAKGIMEEKLSWDPAKVRWEQAEGTQGPYERSEDVNSLEFKALHKDLVAHQGKLSRDGYFYWLFHNGTTIGRKHRRTGESKIG